MFETLVALITPFNEDLQIDFNALNMIIDDLIIKKVDGLVILGTTAETPTLISDERWMLYNYIVRYVNKRIKVFAGIGTNNTQESIRYMKMAMQANVDGLLIVTPYYSCPTQKGLYEHMAILAKNTNLPIIIYNVKKRCGVEIEVDTLISLVKAYPNISALKQAGGDYEAFLKIKEQIPTFKLYSGDDNRLIEALKLNYDGLVSVVGNLYLPLIKRIVANKDTLNEADLMLYKDVCDKMYIETSPTPIKYALSLNNYCLSKVRLPLVELMPASKEIIKEFISR